MRTYNFGRWVPVTLSSPVDRETPHLYIQIYFPESKKRFSEAKVKSKEYEM